jgi:hypothetical protein
MPMKRSDVAKDLAELFADSDAKTKLEALRIATGPERIRAWAAIWRALAVIVGLVLARYGVW